MSFPQICPRGARSKLNARLKVGCEAKNDFDAENDVRPKIDARPKMMRARGARKCRVPYVE
jgi:hypothetical protein